MTIILTLRFLYIFEDLAYCATLLNSLLYCMQVCGCLTRIFSSLIKPVCFKQS